MHLEEALCTCFLMQEGMLVEAHLDLCFVAIFTRFGTISQKFYAHPYRVYLRSHSKSPRGGIDI